MIIAPQHQFGMKAAALLKHVHITLMNVLHYNQDSLCSPAKACAYNTHECAALQPGFFVQLVPGVFECS